MSPNEMFALGAFMGVLIGATIMLALWAWDDRVKARSEQDKDMGGGE